jgi:hypothetical protein
MIVDDPEKGLVENNVICHEGKGVPCKHLRGDKPGEYSCTVHDKPWYKGSPCDEFTQIESSLNGVCCMGQFIMKGVK